MIGTILGVLCAAFVVFFGLQNDVSGNALGIFLAALPAAFLVVYLLTYARTLAPLQKAEQNTTPRILEMFKKDPLLGFVHAGLFFFLLGALLLGVDAAFTHVLPAVYALAVWFVLMGICLDLLMRFMRRILSYLNPFEVVHLFRQAALRSIQKDREADLCEWIDALGEVGSRALDKGGSSLCNESLHELHKVAQIFLDSSKGLGSDVVDKQAIQMGVKDKITFTLFYLFQRLEMLFNKALDKKLEPVCSGVLAAFGKITVDAAKCDMSLANFPLQYIGVLGLAAHQQKLQDIGLKTTCLYLEVAKSLVDDADISYVDLQEPFFTIIHHMDELAKESFKQNKELPIRALTQAFYDLKALFQEGKAASHRDAAVIISDADRVIAEFMALEAVLKTIPPLSTFTGVSDSDAPPDTSGQEQNPAPSA